MPIIEEITEVNIEVVASVPPVATEVQTEPPPLEEDSNKEAGDSVNDVEEKERKVLIEMMDDKGKRT